MSENAKRKTPYVPWSTFVNYLNETAEVGLPPVVDRSILSNFSGSVQSILLSALRGTELVDDDGVPTSRFKALVNADSEEEQQNILRDCLRDGFPYFFDGTVDLKTATPAQFDDQLRSKGGLSGSTLDKAALFFMTGAEHTGVVIGPYLKKRKPTSRRTSRPRKPKVQEKENGKVEERANPSEFASDNGAALDLHPFIQGLLETLPAEKEVWSYKDRAKWLTLAANAFELIYEAEDDGHVNVTVA